MAGSRISELQRLKNSNLWEGEKGNYYKRFSQGAHSFDLDYLLISGSCGDAGD